jgi:hypothetical protein
MIAPGRGLCRGNREAVKMESGSRFRHTGTYLEQDIDEEYLLFDAKGSTIHVLNGVAREIYLLCDGDLSLDALIQTILSRYKVDEARVRADVIDTIGKLVEIGALIADQGAAR